MYPWMCFDASSSECSGSLWEMLPTGLCTFLLRARGQFMAPKGLPTLLFFPSQDGGGLHRLKTAGTSFRLLSSLLSPPRFQLRHKCC